MARTGLSAKNVWGKIVLFLKEHRIVALHVACGDITDVQIQGNKLIVRAEDNMLYQLLLDGKKELDSALRWQGLELEIEIIKLEKVIPPEDEDIAKLKLIAGEYFKLNGGE